LLVEQQPVLLEQPVVRQQPVLLEQLVVRQQPVLLELLVVQAHLQVLRVEMLRFEMQLVLKLSLVKILELVEFHLLVHQLPVLWLLLKLELLVSMF
jgi:hypothetical protein